MDISPIYTFSDVEALLATASLVTADLQTNHTVQVFGIYHDQKLIACIGIEVYEKIGFLRSLVVDNQFRGRGIGRRLLKYIEHFCEKNKIHEAFLLTLTAEIYLRQQGYTSMDRDKAPSAIKKSTQFSSLCPSSSILMRKIIK